MKLVLVILLIVTGCSSAKRPVVAPVPGCPGAKVEVPSGCYPSVAGGHTEVRCPGGTTTYTCKGRTK